MTSNCKMEGVIKRFKEAALKPDSTDSLMTAYLNYVECKNKEADTLLYEFGLPQELVDTFAKIEDAPGWEEVVRKEAEEYLNAFEDKTLLHQKRKEKIEDAIRLLLKGLYEKHEGNITSVSLTLLAKAYLRRSQIIRPKGKTIPEKKKEAIQKGIKYAKEAIDKGRNKEAYRVKAMCYLELDRLEKEGDEPIQDVLKEALDNGCREFDQSIDDVKIAVLYSELASDKTTYFEGVKNSSLRGIELEKARMYTLVGDYGSLKDEMGRLVRSLKKRLFSDPLWDDTVRFLVEKLYEKVDCWKELSTVVWKACQSVERKTLSPLHIRWYWSRMRNLYDLAFLAADDIEQKVRIADSLKSRPALRWSAIEELPGQKDMIEAYAYALTGYLKEIPKSGAKPPKPLPVTAVPPNWIVIHFYLNHLKKKGYALIYDGGWREEPPFGYDKLFDAFRAWQTSYNRKKMDADRETVDLCKTIGEEMSFLFKLSNGNRPVLFIPHDFLHRLPLHGAINKKEEVFLEKHPSCYLPAWSFVQKKEPSAPKPNGKILIKNFPESEYPFPNLNKIQWTFSRTYFEPLPSPPQLLVILCDGKADAVNPFNARLVLTKGATHLEILNLEADLNGSYVILGACETDLVPTLSGPLDEHLSISTAFLTKGASKVLGTMWKVRPDDVEKITTEVDNAGKFWDWQEQGAKDLRDGDENMFFRTVAFRIIGLLGSWQYDS